MKSATPKIGDDIRDICPQGPARVVVDGEGCAVNCRRAREQHGIEPAVIFVRDDGWTLGAPLRFSNVARRLWDGSWIGVVRRPSFTIEALE